MTTFKIPYNGTNYSLYLSKEKITTPSLTISGEGHAPLYSEKKIGDPILEGTNILKCAPVKITDEKTGTVYRPTWLHGILGSATCDVYYKASYTLHEGTQIVRVCTRYNQYGQCISWGNQTQYRYYWDTNSNIKITNFAITNGDMRIVMDNFTCNGYNVLDTQSSWYSTNSNWGGWTTRRWSNYPAKAGYTLTATASGTYSLQINVNNTWITLKTGTASCNFSVPINSETQQKVTVTLELS